MKLKIADMAEISAAAAIITACSWLSIPAAIPFTLQTFGIFCSLGTLGGKRGSAAIIIYVLLGAVGVPVFSGFTGGVGVLFGATGGFIFGFVLAGAAYWLLTRLGLPSLPSMIAGNIVCYLCGAAWFTLVYSGGGFLYALSVCVLPFLLPDAVKIALAALVSRRLKKAIRI